MTDMRCARCGQFGIHWRDLTTSPWTYCPHCGGTNCQEAPEESDEEICRGCGDGDKVPAEGYWRCPVCDAEWWDEEDDDG